MLVHNEQDFLVVNRRNERGVWRTELLTARDFEPTEILRAPLFSQLKEIHAKGAAHDVVTFPKHGRPSSESKLGHGWSPSEHRRRERTLGIRR